jgi:hypothetical protein
MRPREQRPERAPNDDLSEALKRGNVPQVGQSRPDARVAETAPAERRLMGFMGEVRRVGRWAVPRIFRARAFLAEVKVDLRDNAIPADFTFDVRAFGSRVTLIVPPGINVRFDVFALIGNAINQAHEQLPEARNTPSMTVRGSVVLGEVRVLVRPRELSS